ncbi:hypothetical protein BC833DRAFT_638652 [Globomyces pollinis-pini]|nr:hypothetical protein BC833DRAFT_638652 [Globomyces pollinis-pini]
MTVEDAAQFKALGNKAFSAGDYQTAINYFTQAIENDPINHVLYSNRSACYASLKNFTEAVKDAEKTIEIKPDWAKGYSRKGAALHGLGELPEAAETYKLGLTYEPENQALKKALNDVEKAVESSTLNGLGNIFGPDVIQKMAANPRLSQYLSQPDIMEKVLKCQQDPKNMSLYMQDQRMMQIMLGLMGLDGQVATNDEELERAKEEANENLERRAAEKEQASKPAEPKPASEPMEVDLTEEQIKRNTSDEHKAKGNAFYKKRQFEEALVEYDAAWAADESNVAVLTNKSAVLFEMEKYNDCIEVCNKAIDVGREYRADFKLIGRALGRIGSAYAKLDDLENAIKFYNSSLAEHRTADTLTKLREIEALKQKKEKEAYLNPELADQEREKGNEFFKKNQFPDAVKCYSEAIKRNPSDPRNYSNRAACYSKLMALPEAERDCDEAIKLDENFVKAYIRKANVQFNKREYTKSIETCQTAITKDTDGKHQTELQNQINKAYYALNQSTTGGNAEETRKAAMSNPEVQQILGDPVMQTILKQMQEDPAAIRDHMKNPTIAKKMEVLINAGIVQMGR